MIKFTQIFDGDTDILQIEEDTNDYLLGGFKHDFYFP